MVSGKILVAIPAYDPPMEKLREIILGVCDFSDVVIVNDGSAQETLFFFDSGEKTYDVTVLEHAKNLGKGAAIKTALGYAIEEGYIGVLIADADGQHSIEDIQNVYVHASRNKSEVILGVRSLDVDVPFRSRLGNLIMTMLVRLLSKSTISDTQTGLRYIPAAQFPICLAIRQNRYDFELIQLLRFLKTGVEIKEVSIDTIYLDGNVASKFRPVLDSLRVLKSLVKFGVSGLVCSLVDYASFVVLMLIGVNVQIALILARSISICLNFFLNYRVVFESSVGIFFSFGKYLLLASFNLFILWQVFSYFEVSVGHAVLLKILTESTLFGLNFLVQKYVIFKR